MSEKKYRLVTRADFDGAVSGCLLMELGMIGEVAFAEPKQVQDGEVEIDGNDILTNLPSTEAATSASTTISARSNAWGPTTTW